MKSAPVGAERERQREIEGETDFKITGHTAERSEKTLNKIQEKTGKFQ